MRNTAGCTTKGMQFRDLLHQVVKAGVVVVGGSRDSPKTNKNFKKKMGFPFELISDMDEKLCAIRWHMKTKICIAMQVRGTERSPFVVDRSPTLVREWRGVKVPGHCAGRLDVVRTL